MNDEYIQKCKKKKMFCLSFDYVRTLLNGLYYNSDFF